MNTCSNCGHPLPANARFCVNCGRTIEMPVDAVETEATPISWRPVEAIPIFLMTLGATLVLTFMLAIFIHDKDLLTVCGIAVNEIMTVVVLLVWMRRVHQAGPRDLALKGFTPQNVGIGVAIGATGIFLAGLVGLFVEYIVEAIRNKPISPPDQIPLDHPATGAVLVLTGISVILLAPIAEEMFFRGFIFRGLRARWKAAPAVVMSAVVFALVHILPLVLLPIFALGVLLAMVVEQRQSLVPSIVAHMTFNAFSFLLQFVIRN